MVMLGSLSPSELATLNLLAMEDERCKVVGRINQQILARVLGFSSLAVIDPDSIQDHIVVTGIPETRNGVPYLTRLIRSKDRMPLYSHKHNTLEEGERIRKDIIECVQNGKPLAGIP